MSILKSIPGFRTGVWWKSVIAIFGYLTIVISLIATESKNFQDVIIDLIQKIVMFGVLYILVTNVGGIRNKLPLFKSKKKLAGFIVFGIVYLVIGGTFINITETMRSPEYKAVIKKSKKIEQQKDNEAKEKKEKEELQKAAEKKLLEQLTFTGDMNYELNENIITIKITSNVPDGGLFEVTLINGDLNILSEFIPIKGGIIEKDFIIPKKWKAGYIAVTALFRFNVETTKQPQNILDIYGSTGEKMKGSQAQDNHLGGKNGVIEGITIAYPDEATIKKEQDKAFLNVLNEMIRKSDGVILRIQPYLQDDDWSTVAVTVNDSWYYSAEYEKERFAEQISEVIQNVIYNSEKVEKDSIISVYFFDRYNKKLASPKVFGGYKIER
ncbi:MAG: hypothetical protein ACM3YE_16415 [Bacteroidota bacterium]